MTFEKQGLSQITVGPSTVNAIQIATELLRLVARCYSVDITQPGSNDTIRVTTVDPWSSAAGESLLSVLKQCNEQLDSKNAGAS